MCVIVTVVNDRFTGELTYLAPYRLDDVVSVAASNISKDSGYSSRSITGSHTSSHSGYVTLQKYITIRSPVPTGMLIMLSW